jgi:hypothetical protein
LWTFEPARLRNFWSLDDEKLRNLSAESAPASVDTGFSTTVRGEGWALLSMSSSGDPVEKAFQAEYFMHAAPHFLLGLVNIKAVPEAQSDQ